MSKSLQDQLRQAGLASQKQAVKARKAKNTKEKMQRKGAAVIDETAEQVKRQEQEKRERDRLLNEEKHKAEQHRAVQAQIGQLIELNVIGERGESEYRFNDHGVIRTLMLKDDTRNKLINGIFAIVGESNQTDDHATERHIVPRQVAEKIIERDASWLVLMNDRDTEDTTEEDEYAGYEVPDDLMW